MCAVAQIDAGSVQMWALASTERTVIADARIGVMTGRQVHRWAAFAGLVDGVVGFAAHIVQVTGLVQHPADKIRGLVAVAAVAVVVVEGEDNGLAGIGVVGSGLPFLEEEKGTPRCCSRALEVADTVIATAQIQYLEISDRGKNRRREEAYAAKGEVDIGFGTVMPEDRQPREVAAHVEDILLTLVYPAKGELVTVGGSHDRHIEDHFAMGGRGVAVVAVVAAVGFVVVAAASVVAAAVV